MPLEGVIRFEQVTAGASAIGMTLTPADGVLPTAAAVEVEGAAIRYTTDGTTPTATVGHNGEVGDVIPLPTREQVFQFLAIRRDGVSATLNITQAVGYIP